jgi:hypothetical protein
MAFMASSPAPALSARQRTAVDALLADLRNVFGTRLLSVVAYGLQLMAANEELHTLTLVERLTFDDFTKLVPLASQWQVRGLAVPLVLTRDEFYRTLDVFPLEYGEIIAGHIVLDGQYPFAGAQVADADRRRACELQARSHLIHLREGFLESGGDPRKVVRLIASSAPAFKTLLAHIARLEAGIELTPGTPDYGPEELGAEAQRIIGIPSQLVVDVLASPATISPIVEPTPLLSRYVDASERIWRYVDGWRRPEELK